MSPNLGQHVIIITKEFSNSKIERDYEKNSLHGGQIQHNINRKVIAFLHCL